jgi:hypothetical protein
MRLNSFALCSLSLFAQSCSALAVQGSVPRFNIESTCRAAQPFVGANKKIALSGCLKDEADARDQLAQKWTSFRPQDRTDCVSQGAAPLPSYVELLTCLEMSADAEALNSPGGVHGYKTRGPARQNPPVSESGTPQAEPPGLSDENTPPAKQN